jgi:hypothetical protein
MAWQDSLTELKDELSETRAERRRLFEEEEADIQREREEISRMVENLGVSALLADMNSVLLDGAGKVETIVSWEEDEEDIVIEGEEDDEEGDAIAAILSWDEGGEREIAIDVGASEDGAYVQVNGVDIRPEREALEIALMQAFRDELEL